MGGRFVHQPMMQVCERRVSGDTLHPAERGVYVERTHADDAPVSVLCMVFSMVLISL